jgi:hypothetical protein
VTWMMEARLRAYSVKLSPPSASSSPAKVLLAAIPVAILVAAAAAIVVWCVFTMDGHVVVSPLHTPLLTSSRLSQTNHTSPSTCRCTRPPPLPSILCRVLSAPKSFGSTPPPCLKTQTRKLNRDDARVRHEQEAVPVSVRF